MKVNKLNEYFLMGHRWLISAVWQKISPMLMELLWTCSGWVQSGCCSDPCMLSRLWVWYQILFISVLC